MRRKQTSEIRSRTCLTSLDSNNTRRHDAIHWFQFRLQYLVSLIRTELQPLPSVTRPWLSHQQRPHLLEISNHTFTSILLKHRVPQGSVLSPDSFSFPAKTTASLCIDFNIHNQLADGLRIKQRGVPYNTYTHTQKTKEILIVISRRTRRTVFPSTLMELKWNMC